MATYLELYTLSQDPEMRKKLAVAVLVAAEEVNQEDPGTANHTERVAWAARALAFPAQEGQRMWGAVLAANKDLSAAVIEGATDAAIQTKVDLAIDLVALGTA